jgi:hypothetical protein
MFRRCRSLAKKADIRQKADFRHRTSDIRQKHSSPFRTGFVRFPQADFGHRTKEKNFKNCFIENNPSGINKLLWGYKGVDPPPHHSMGG